MGWVQYSQVLVVAPQPTFEKFSVLLEQEVPCGWTSHLLKVEALVLRS